MKYVEGEPIDSIREAIKLRDRYDRTRQREEKETIIKSLLFQYEARLNTLNLKQLEYMRSDLKTFDPPARIF